jgi:hypothetical protein
VSRRGGVITTADRNFNNGVTAETGRIRRIVAHERRIGVQRCSASLDIAALSWTVLGFADGPLRQRIQEVAATAETSPYAILCGIGRRVVRLPVAGEGPTSCWEAPRRLSASSEAW